MNHILQEDARDILKQDISWENFDGKRILITGAGGMLGSYISRTILQWKEISGNDLELYALVRHPEKLPEDVRDQVKVLRQSVAEPIQTDVDFHYIIHAASPASPLIMREDPVGTIAANTLGAYYTLDLARRSHAEGYLFISSREIYGQPYDDQKEFTEDSYGFVDPLSPRSCYPEGKKAAETMCASFAQQYGLNVKVARLAHTYGPGMSVDDGRVQADFLRDVINDRNIVMKSEGKPIRTYTYVSDAVAAIFRILLDSDEMVYNISSPESTVSIRELAETLADAYADRDIQVVMDLPKETKDTGAAPFTLGILNSDRLHNIGWQPQYSLKEGLMRTVIKNCPIALENPEDYDARANLMWASSLALNGLTGRGKQGVWAVQSGRLLLLGIVSGELRYRKHTQLCAQQEVYIPASGSDRSERIAIHRKHSGVLSAGIWDR